MKLSIEDWTWCANVFHFILSSDLKIKFDSEVSKIFKYHDFFNRQFYLIIISYSIKPSQAIELIKMYLLSWK
ncbi:hypothetical protein BpHYR1_037140 [Brachionus plicatilis]|uniref:Uncharacterized protein n=1 Tax=Brachionus plicatilis TaxID=10195 RepID=A0A3M7T221_BRAPC|nr:hypothetical protein BpHYR1_037140 [Brachionus plicatilis]